MSIELVEVVKRVGSREHIKATSLTLPAGPFNVLLGATGSGKTSLLKLMAGLDSCASGKILLKGADVTKATPQERNISFVHQFFVNYPHLTVFANIASPLRVAGMAKSEIEGRVEAMADLLQLRPMLGRHPHELSGGQQQRTALARALVKESAAVFLDEPLANLDYKLREELREQLPELLADRGAVVVYATSEPEEALLLGGNTGLMRDGRLVQFGPTGAAYRDPGSLVAAEVFSDPPLNQARISKQGAKAKLGAGVEWELTGKARELADGAYVLGVRPDRVLPAASASSANKVDGRITVTELSGSHSSAHFRFGEHDWVSLAPGVQPYAIGDDHSFYVDPAHCFLFAESGERAA